ncbi:MAG TPA: tripartite tricarboxylate transporter substrate binding protein [Hyphomicrobiaceae bacterium]|jgi:tripartite-type tricarboxylate transporter receptor subunit TctC|nr:tripartite tricarboxylate transporter substrate binding protein [Hyphomicrobiaceae bacterium]
MRNTWHSLLTAFGALLLLTTAATAQEYPTKPVRLIVPFPPGGSNDVVGRIVATQLGERLGKQVVVDNRGGAGGVLGTEAAANAPPDGYTLLVISLAHAVNPGLYKLKYDPIKSFVPVAMLGSGINVLCIHPSVPANTLQELIALAKKKPGELNYASAGSGSFQHMGAELFKLMAGVDIVHVPFKGGGPAMIDVVGGHSQMLLSSLIQTMPHIRSGKLKPLGTGGTKRSAILPDVPTIAEGGVPGYEMANWWGIVAPAGTEQAIVDKLSNEIAGVLSMPETQKVFSNEGAEVVQKAGAAFGSFIESELVKWQRVVKEAKIKAD